MTKWTFVRVEDSLAVLDCITRGPNYMHDGMTDYLNRERFDLGHLLRNKNSYGDAGRVAIAALVANARGEG